MYIVIVGNELVGWFKTFKQAERETRRYMHLEGKIPVWICKAIVKDGVIFDR